MLENIAQLAIRAPRRIIAIALLVMAGAAVFGIPVANDLSPGGFDDPTADSAQAAHLIADRFHQGDTQMLITVSSSGGAEGGAARAVGMDIVAGLHDSPYVAQVVSPWTVAPSTAPSLVSKDGNTGLIVAGITGGEKGAQQHAETLSTELVYDRDGVTVRAGGDAIAGTQITHQTQNDLKLMESIAIPLSFVVLVWVFGGVVAAALPLAVGGFAIFGSMAAMRALTFATDISIFALNLSIAMGLALAIDYTLLILSRFRDELADGAGRLPVPVPARADDGVAAEHGDGARRRAEVDGVHQHHASRLPHDGEQVQPKRPAVDEPRAGRQRRGVAVGQRDQRLDHPEPDRVVTQQQVAHPDRDQGPVGRRHGSTRSRSSGPPSRDSTTWCRVGNFQPLMMLETRPLCSIWSTSMQL